VRPRRGSAEEYPSLTILAIKQIAHGFAPGSIRAFIGFQNVGRFRPGVRILFAARGAAIGEARLARLKFKFLSASDASFDREYRHISLYFIADTNV
jgi:hypothetical protein